MAPTALGRALAVLLTASCLALAGLRAAYAGGDGQEVETALEHEAPGLLATFFRATTLTALPAEEHRLVEFLLLLPLAGVVIGVFRNLIGLPSFGTFAPVLIGLAFRELSSWPGVLVFVAVLLVGWGLRRLVEPLHLLEVPRASLLLSLVVVLLIVAVLVSHAQQVPVTKYVSLMPLVILTGIIERLWSMELEEGALASLRTLLGTLTIAVTISLVLAIPGLVAGLVRYPELIGLCMAVQLLLGRYTGYRLTEIYRFRELVADEAMVESPQVEARRVRATPGRQGTTRPNHATKALHGVDTNTRELMMKR